MFIQQHQQRQYRQRSARINSLERQSEIVSFDIIRFSGHVLDVPKMWSGGNVLRSTQANEVSKIRFT